jgi:CRP/FNR family transcriptional regulator, cyclic AMP receptor protein
MSPSLLHPDRRIEFLKKVRLFSGCSRQELSKIASLTTETHVPAGTVLAKQGQAGDEFFVIVEGTAVASRNEVELARFGPGSFFGELALLDGGERTATVVVESDARLLVLSRREFQSLHMVAPEVGYKMLTELGARLRKADQLLDEQQFNEVIGPRGTL